MEDTGQKSYEERTEMPATILGNKGELMEVSFLKTVIVIDFLRIIN